MPSGDIRPASGDWRRAFAPLGVPTLIIADHPALLETALAAYADWVGEAPAAAPVIELRLGLGGASSGKVSDGIRIEGSRLALADAGIDGRADARTGRARCVVPPRLLDDPPAIAEAIDTLLLFLLARMGRPPLHAAGLMLGDTALLLAGPSGSGKSTLALAWAAEGLPVLSDDTVHLQLEPEFRIWSFARPIHVFADEAPPGDHAIRVRSGKRKAAVRLPPASGARRSADRAVLVVLDRAARPALDPIDAEDAVAALMRLDPGFDLLPLESARAIRAAARGGAWRLALTGDPAAAIALLRTRPELTRSA